ncbi:MAG TPA: lysine--tRNA ligase [Acidobacteriaceae bacterium]
MPQFESDYEEKLYNDRVASLEKIRAIGQRLGLSAAEAAYPNQFPFTHTLPGLRPLGFTPAGEPKSTEELEATPVEAAIAGRIVTIRGGFAVLQQGGQRFQIYVHKDAVGPDLFELYKLLHIGDHIGVRGHMMRTRTGELTLKVQAIQLAGHENQPTLVFLAKAMLALPDKYHGLEDVELRYRQRYVDLIMNSGSQTRSEAAAPSEVPPGTSATTDTAAPNEEHDDAPRNVREVFVKRAAVLRAIRKFFDARDYIEVETPMLHSIAGGAAARPFTTHHNTLDMELYLRIAPELYLKRLVVGGMDRVYEINRNFRNDGVSTKHNPEFTMLEFYQAYANYHDLMDLSEELIKFVAMEVNGTTSTHFNGNEINLGKWLRISMRDAIRLWWPVEFGAKPSDEDLASSANLTATIDRALKAYGFEPLAFKGQEADLSAAARTLAENARVLAAGRDTLAKGSPAGRVIAEIFEALAEEHLIQPTIIYDFPLAVSPLSKVKPDEPDWVERFEFYIGGFEVGNAFSELNDPADQERRFEAQLEEKARGDDEAMEMDADYVRALAFGLPPTGGEGIGIDRLTMLLTGSRSIRDVILFPLMRSLNKSAAAEEAEHNHGESAE